MINYFINEKEDFSKNLKPVDGKIYIVNNLVLHSVIAAQENIIMRKNHLPDGRMIDIITFLPSTIVDREGIQMILDKLDNDKVFNPSSEEESAIFMESSIYLDTLDKAKESKYNDINSPIQLAFKMTDKLVEGIPDVEHIKDFLTKILNSYERSKKSLMFNKDEFGKSILSGIRDYLDAYISYKNTQFNKYNPEYEDLIYKWSILAVDAEMCNQHKIAYMNHDQIFTHIIDYLVAGIIESSDNKEKILRDIFKTDIIIRASLKKNPFGFIQILKSSIMGFIKDTKKPEFAHITGSTHITESQRYMYERAYLMTLVNYMIETFANTIYMRNAYYLTSKSIKRIINETYLKAAIKVKEQFNDTNN